MNDSSSASGEFLKRDMNEERKQDDGQNLLPTDDQLDHFVDTLCENLPTLQLGSSPGSSVTSENYESDNSNPTGAAVHQPSQLSACSEISRSDNGGIKDTILSSHSSDQSKFTTSRRSTSNTNLNVAIVQCTRSLELLIERRKNLEFLIRKRHNFTNSNYNVAYTPRLPDAPTRVDRLLFDINQERGRIVSLITELEKTINSYSSKTAKEDVKKLLMAYGNAIVEVIKERQNEINSLHGCGTDSGVHRLVELVDQVHRMNRLVHTALWCLEVKEQFNMAMSRRRGAEASQGVLEHKPADGVMLPKSWRPSTKLVLGSQSPQSPRVSRASPNVGTGSKIGLGSARGTPQPQANPFQALSPPIRAKKSTAFQLIAQQQRAEIFQRFSSSLKKPSLGV